MTQGAEHILLEEQQFWKHRIHQIDQEEDKSTAAGLLYDISPQYFSIYRKILYNM